MNQPKMINARFTGVCTDCGTTIYTGDRCEHYAKGKVRCEACSSAAPTAPGSTGAPTGGNSAAWDAAMSWNDTAPVAGSSVGTANDAAQRSAIGASSNVVKLTGPDSIADRLAKAREAERLERERIARENHARELARAEQLEREAAELAAKRDREQVETEAAAKRLDAAQARDDARDATPQPISASDSDIVLRLIHEQLVTVVNAVGALSATKRGDLARACQFTASVAGSPERAHVWRKLADVIR